MKKVWLFILVDTIWILGFLLVVGISSYPILMAGRWIFDSLGFEGLAFTVPLLLFLWLNLYIITVGLIHFCFVPGIKEGNFRILGKEWIKWRLNWILYSYVFLFFNKYVLFNKFIKTPFFRLMGARVYYTTYLGETANFQDVNNLLSIGRDTLVASEVILATHLSISEKYIRFKRVTIGDHSFVGARASIGPGVTIGNRVLVNYNVGLSLNVSVGDGTVIEGGTVVHSSAKIGKNCKIGMGVIIQSKSVVPDGTVIPDGAIWSNR